MSTSRFPKKSSRLVGNHNRCWIWGRNVLLEALRVGHWRPQELWLTPRCPDYVTREARQLAEQWQIATREATDAELTRACRSEDHQGIAGVFPDFPYADFGQLLQAVTLDRWLVLDGIQDSFNFGAMLRSAVELGIDAVLIGTAGQVGVNSQAARSSAGAVNHVPIARVDDLTAAVRALKTEGVALVAASEKAKLAISEVSFPERAAIVIGNEGVGISESIWSLCDVHARIPIAGRVSSLNAAVAAGILCYEMNRQRP